MVFVECKRNQTIFARLLLQGGVQHAVLLMVDLEQPEGEGDGDVVYGKWDGLPVIHAVHHDLVPHHRYVRPPEVQQCSHL
jgi:hypothetical protein